jgi:hypothetical protein
VTLKLYGATIFSDSKTSSSSPMFDANVSPIIIPPRGIASMESGDDGSFVPCSCCFFSFQPF